MWWKAGEQPRPNLPGKAGEAAVQYLKNLAHSDLPPWRQLVNAHNVVEGWRSGVAVQEPQTRVLAAV